MRRIILRVIGLSAALVAAATVWLATTLPPAAEHPSITQAPGTFVSGAYHVHSDRSDGSGSIDDIAAAAARAGLQFVILTDHGDATRAPEPAAYRHGVLCIDAVEISTVAGHIVALNLQNAAPYRLGGEGRDVIEDIHRLGGWAVAAHPDSPRSELRWRGGGLPIDGVEWLNVDSEWRRPTKLSLAAAAGRAWFRGPETIASLFRPGGGLERWDMSLRAHQTFALAAVDAHARMGEDKDDARPSGPFALSLPSYETMFRTVINTVTLDRPLNTPGADAARDASSVLSAIGAGRSYSVVRAFVDAPPAFEFSATSGADRVDFGGVLSRASSATVRAAVPAAVGGRVVILKDGRELASGEARAEALDAGPGVYRVEVRLANRPVPWLVSNAIRVGAIPETRPPAPAPSPMATQPAIVPIPLDSWTIEKHPATDATLVRAGDELKLRYRLGGGAPSGQYVALATAASGGDAIEEIVFAAFAPRPVRLSIQIRLPGGADGQRWRRSVYIDQTPRPIRVRLADLEPVERTTLTPITTKVQSILLVIDTINAAPGSGGEVVLRETGYVRAKSGPDR